MAGPLDYSTTAASNTTVGGVNIAEGMAPGSVNNAMRAMMADSRKWQLDWSGVTTAGSSNAYTMTCNQGITAYADGMRFSFRADRNNTGAATLNIDGRGAKALRKVVSGSLVALAADDIVAKAIYDVVFLLADDVFAIVGNLAVTGWTYAAAQATTSGSAIDFTGIPSWVTEIKLILNGVSLSSTGDLAVQLGDAGGFEATGYTATSAALVNAGAVTVEEYTTAFGIVGNNAGGTYAGEIVLTKYSGNTWSSSHSLGAIPQAVAAGGGVKTLSDTLTQVRFTRIGADTFDAGAVIAMWR